MGALSWLEWSRDRNEDFRSVSSIEGVAEEVRVHIRKCSRGGAGTAFRALNIQLGETRAQPQSWFSYEEPGGSQKSFTRIASEPANWLVGLHSVQFGRYIRR